MAQGIDIVREVRLRLPEHPADDLNEPHVAKIEHRSRLGIANDLKLGRLPMARDRRRPRGPRRRFLERRWGRSQPRRMRVESRNDLPRHPLSLEDVSNDTRKHGHVSVEQLDPLVPLVPTAKSRLRRSSKDEQELLDGPLLLEARPERLGDELILEIADGGLEVAVGVEGDGVGRDALEPRLEGFEGGRGEVEGGGAAVDSADFFDFVEGLGPGVFPAFL